MMSMTMKNRYCMMAVGLLMAACAEDNPLEVRPDGKVRVDVGCESQTEVQVGTRAAADGYTEFGGADYNGVQLGVIAWQKNTQKYDQGFATYSYSNGAGKWTSNVYLAKQQYNVYGYMPHNGEANSIQPDLGSETDPSTFAMKWTGQPTFATMPVLASVGSARSTLGSVTDGSFAVDVDQVGQEEKINFRMNHLLAKLTLQFYLPKPYADKRKIKVTQVTLGGAQGVANRYDITCSYDASGALTTTYAPMQGAPATGNNYPYTAGNAADGLFLTTSKQLFGTYYFVPDAVNSSSNLMTLTVTYNVYDQNGNPTREHQTATNARIALHKVNTVAQATQVAHEYTANVKVVPSYLYVLSDRDMQNPYIVLN